jgi:proline dehydrogenase
LVCSEAYKNNALLIDEESWMQDAADELVTDMMRKYNKESQLCSIHCNCIVGIVWII